MKKSARPGLAWTLAGPRPRSCFHPRRRQCANYLAGKVRRTTTNEHSLTKAKEIAEDWYLQLRGKLRSGELKSGKLFRQAAELNPREFDNIAQGQRIPTCARGQHARTNGYLVHVIGSMVLPEITAGKVNEHQERPGRVELSRLTDEA